MKIAFSAKGTGWEDPIDPRFGRTEYFVLYDEGTQELSFIDNTDVVHEAHGAGPRTAQKLYEQRVDVLITGNGPGGNAASVLEKSGVKVYAGAENKSVKQAYEAYKNGELKLF